MASNHTIHHPKERRSEAAGLTPVNGVELTYAMDEEHCVSCILSDRLYVLGGETGSYRERSAVPIRFKMILMMIL